MRRYPAADGPGPVAGFLDVFIGRLAEQAKLQSQFPAHIGEMSDFLAVVIVRERRYGESVVALTYIQEFELHAEAA